MVRFKAQASKVIVVLVIDRFDMLKVAPLATYHQSLNSMKFPRHIGMQEIGIACPITVIFSSKKDL
ncbi:hypothetical protein ACVRXE_04750 [Streptococcus porci]